MKKAVNVCVGGNSFILEEDAYFKLDSYLQSFRDKTEPGSQGNEIMDEVEIRIAELFTDALADNHKEVISISLVSEVIGKVGMPDGSTPPEDGDTHTENGGTQPKNEQTQKEEYTSTIRNRKFYRDPTGMKIGGVCGGLAAFLDFDVTLVRAIALASLLLVGTGLIVYLILWIIAPLAVTAVQRCEMHGMEPTAENIKRYSVGTAPETKR